MTDSMTWMAIAVAAVAASGSAQAACVDGQSTGGKVYVGVQQPDPLGGLLFRCAPQSATTIFTGPVTYESGTFDVSTALTASAWVDDFGLHASARSKPVPHLHEADDPLGAFPGYALAQASSNLTFTLVAPASAPAGERSPVTFEALGAGTLQGASGFFRGRSAYEMSFSSNGRNWTDTGFYRDTEGVSTDFNYRSNFSTGPRRGIEFGINYTGTFLAGVNGFTLRMDVVAIGDGEADFSHTVALAGLRVAPGYTLTLPDGLYTADANDPGHYILTSLLPVPEPSTSVLMLAGMALLLAGRWARRCAAHATNSSPDWQVCD